MLGAALSTLSKARDFFCTLADIKAILTTQLSGVPSKLETFSAAIDVGYRV
jgi:hypothetical protein